jgi:two-component sensor histidine kinase
MSGNEDVFSSDLSSPSQVDQLLGSSKLAVAIENNRYKHLLDHVPVALAVSRGVGADQRVVYVNKAFEILTAMSAADVETKPWSCLDSFRNEDDHALALGQAIVANVDFLGVFRPEPAADPLIVVQAYAAVIEGDGGAESFRIAALVDVGGRERAQIEQFELQIRDRDMLLHELQHRVKNNLQLITALIRLEARAASEGEAVALSRLASRIDALTVLYRTLAVEGSEQDIDLGKYLADVADAVMQANAAPGVTCETQVDYCPLSINLAMPTGLLVNEMLTNALKYAFTGRDSGRIKLLCEVKDERVTVIVTDDGIGLGDNLVWPSPRKLGSLVLQTLKENAQNVKFAAESLPGQGTWFTLSFDQSPARLPN